MKKWTVMVIPQGRGSTRTLTIRSSYVWLLVGLFTLLAFSSTFLFQRFRLARNEAEDLRKAKRRLEFATGVPQKEVGLADEERRELEQRLRQEYQARQKIVSELSALYDLDKEIRQMHQIPSGKGAASGRSSSEPRASRAVGGKGGPPGRALSGETIAETSERFRPPHVIYGLSQPSADLIIQEIRTRLESFRELLVAMRARRDNIEHRPTVTPCLHPAARITSGFGWRRDPFSPYALRHHDGVDISAPPGSDVAATAKGVVLSAEWEAYLGNTVRIDHGGGVVTVYAHLQRCTVRPGQEVARGSRIGTVGSTGRTTGPHLHYELHVNGKPVNPRRYLGN